MIKDPFLHGVMNIHLNPTKLAFISPNGLKAFIEKFNIAGVITVEDDLDKTD